MVVVEELGLSKMLSEASGDKIRVFQKQTGSALSGPAAFGRRRLLRAARPPKGTFSRRTKAGEMDIFPGRAILGFLYNKHAAAAGGGGASVGGVVCSKTEIGLVL